MVDFEEEFSNVNRVGGTTGTTSYPKYTIYEYLKYSKWSNLVSSKYHAAKILLAVEQGYVNMGDLHRLGHVLWSRYLQTSLDAGIFEKFSLPNVQKSEISILKGVGKQVENMKFYRLTPEAFAYFTQPDNERYLREVADYDKIKLILSEKQEEIKDILKQNEARETRERLAFILRMYRDGIKLSFEDKEFYYNQLGRYPSK